MELTVRPSAAAALQPNPKIRIYIVDDHPLIRSALATVVSVEPDIQVCGSAATAEVAFNEIVRLLPDVTLVDLSLNGNSGLELIKSIRSLDHRIGIIVVSMHAEAIYGLRALRAGASGYVTKDEAPEKIIAAIRQIRSGRVFASHSLTERIIGSLREDRRPNGDSPVSSLSDRELQVLELIGRGCTTAEIAARLHVSIKTVETHRGHMKIKLHVDTSAQLVHFCVRWIHEKNSVAVGMGC